MSKLRVATWNAEGMFVKGTQTRRANPHDALQTLRMLDADIVVIPEFGNIKRLEESVVTTIKALGYQLVINPYDDPRATDLGFGFLSRLPIDAQRTVPLPVTGRSILEVYCRDESGTPIRFVGVHLDDREEAIRMKEVKSVVDVINTDTSTPTMLMGDFNAMHASSGFAKLARTKTVAMLAYRIPNKQVASVARRAQEMAIGTTIDYLLQHTALHNLDPAMTPTVSAKQRGMEWAPSMRLAKIDWIFGSPHIIVEAHHVKKDVGSDHRPVVVQVAY